MTFLRSSLMEIYIPPPPPSLLFSLSHLPLTLPFNLSYLSLSTPPFLHLLLSSLIHLCLPLSLSTSFISLFLHSSTSALISSISYPFPFLVPLTPFPSHHNTSLLPPSLNTRLPSTSPHSHIPHALTLHRFPPLP